MKRKIITALLCCAMSLSIVGCRDSSGTSNADNVKISKDKKSEYNIDEFLEIWGTIGEKVDKDTEYTTEENMIAERTDSFLAHLKETDLNKGDVITLRGKIVPLDVSPDGKFSFWVVKSDFEFDVKNRWNHVTCTTDNTKASHISEMDNIEVTGTLYEKDGIRSIGLVDCTIISPNLDDYKYKANAANDF